MAEATSSSGAGDVFVWHASVADAWSDPARFSAALTWLTPVEHARYLRYRHDRDRRMFLLGRTMARAVVGRAMHVAPTAWPWRDGGRGRPEVGMASATVSFNLAHSADLVVCALAHGCDVGVDVEDRSRPPVDEAIVTRFCAPTEIADIEAQGPDTWRDRFLMYWTLKEAYLKARGLGIAVHLSHVCFHLEPGPIAVEFLDSLAGTDTNWAFELGAIGDRHVVAVAAPVMNGARPRFHIAPFPADLLP